jgi:hypothetical protein
MANEFDANQGLQEGRRVNPGPAKLPAKTYMTTMDVMFVFASGLAALWFIVEHHEKLLEGLWKLLSVVTGGG